jgi:hypothetical protein
MKHVLIVTVSKNGYVPTKFVQEVINIHMLLKMNDILTSQVFIEGVSQEFLDIVNNQRRNIYTHIVFINPYYPITADQVLAKVGS